MYVLFELFLDDSSLTYRTTPKAETYILYGDFHIITLKVYTPNNQGFYLAVQQKTLEQETKTFLLIEADYH